MAQPLPDDSMSKGWRPRKVGVAVAVAAAIIGWAVGVNVGRATAPKPTPFKAPDSCYSGTSSGGVSEYARTMDADASEGFAAATQALFQAAAGNDAGATAEMRRLRGAEAEYKFSSSKLLDVATRADQWRRDCYAAIERFNKALGDS